MKILIVNGYKPTPLGKERFEIFVKLIKEGFKKHRAKCSSDWEFIIRDIHDIDEFLFESFSKYGIEEAQKRFDSIDLVFMDGEANYLPWSTR